MRSRLSELTPGKMSDEQQRVLDAILSGPRGNLDGPFLAWIHSPGLADPAQALGAYCRYHTSMPLRLSELAILVTASWWQSQAEWQIHEPIARRAGIVDPVIDALRLGSAPVFERADEQLVYQIGCTLYQTKRIDDALYHRAIAEFGEPALVELVGIFGYYALVAMTLNVFEVRRDGAPELPFTEPG
ncbi:carboxymuconolactone decarboxylase family protein [Marinobacterium sedimentorum]|uniref:carboxymuconolactone decarboxylase family protein n=1 Tax=Marinobacterium sedimentorum TaxID=2927804 RepID=UPI0020C5CB54|nr:carboxymuconolactone decarboxylase family protein [Marinobacterium sedimentorum]MCP8687389.1 carboxymuconolactone decarboxylase family protein [Marinobacterium sedimentorum]